MIFSPSSRPLPCHGKLELPGGFSLGPIIVQIIIIHIHNKIFLDSSFKILA